MKHRSIGSPSAASIASVLGQARALAFKPSNHFVLLASTCSPEPGRDQSFRAGKDLRDPDGSEKVDPLAMPRRRHQLTGRDS